MSRSAAKDSFAPNGAHAYLIISTTAVGRGSAAAPRLNQDVLEIFDFKI
jgi:hypothetical protein